MYRNILNLLYLTRMVLVRYNKFNMYILLQWKINVTKSRRIDCFHPKVIMTILHNLYNKYYIVTLKKWNFELKTNARVFPKTLL